MTNEELQKAIEIAEESVAGFADKGSFEMLLAEAVLELRERLNTERVTVANWIMHRGFATGHGDAIVDMLDELEWQVAEHERKKIKHFLTATSVSVQTRVYIGDEEISMLKMTHEEIRARGQE